MKCGYYWIINPAPTLIVENDNRLPVFEVFITFKGTKYAISVFNSDEGRPELIKLLIPALSKEEVPKELLPFVQGVKEHMLTALRLTYNPFLSLWDFAVWSFSDDNKSPSINLRAEWRFIPHFDAELTRNVFSHSLEHREQFRLFSNGANEGIPAQYRFLSLYKLIEMQFRRRGKWNDSKFRELARRFEVDFRQKGITADPITEIHAWRDRCAHVRTGKKREILGVSELNHGQLVSLLKILPVISKMGAEILRELTNGKVILQPVVREELWDRQVAG